MLSCIQDNTCLQTARLGTDAKILLKSSICHEKSDETYLYQQPVDIVLPYDTSIGENRLIHSINEMDAGLEKIGVGTYDLDNLSPTLLKTYDMQQQRYLSDNVFSLLSLIGMSLLELGLIIEYDGSE